MRAHFREHITLYILAGVLGILIVIYTIQRSDGPEPSTTTNQSQNKNTPTNENTSEQDMEIGVWKPFEVTGEWKCYPLGPNMQMHINNREENFTKRKQIKFGINGTPRDYHHGNLPDNYGKDFYIKVVNPDESHWIDLKREKL